MAVAVADQRNVHLAVQGEDVAGAPPAFSTEDGEGGDGVAGDGGSGMVLGGESRRPID